jgi:hypothetical protein
LSNEKYGIELHVKTLFHMKKGLLLILFLSIFGLKAQVQPSSPKVFSVHQNRQILKLRFNSNHEITEKNKNIKNLVVYIHGATRNAMEYYQWAENAVNASKKSSETLLIVPQFTAESDLDSNGQDLSHVFWASNGWRIGDETASSEARPFEGSISSFTLLDSMVYRVCNKTLFPKLKNIIIVGHSAGGQFVQRYAAMAPQNAGYTYKYIVMNPSSYLYFDERRPINDGSTLSFEIPSNTDCEDYNKYPKGFEELNPYAQMVGMEKMLEQFLERDIVFVMGGDDVDMEANSLDKTCSGKLQGRYRLERGQFFYEYLKLYGKSAKINRFDIVPEVGHSGDRMINSEITRKYIFE